ATLTAPAALAGLSTLAALTGLSTLTALTGLSTLTALTGLSALAALTGLSALAALTGLAALAALILHSILVVHEALLASLKNPTTITSRLAITRRRSTHSFGERPTDHPAPVSECAASTGFDSGEPRWRRNMLRTTIANSDMNSLCQFCSDSNQNCEVRKYPATETV